ncbi:MAG: TipAS antibiotic-recognition domain-containing protein, partial [Clostridia bacterium]|nr:TipAS antibiotic-recognition domain-containing protein [Clostridia bacterium]
KLYVEDSRFRENIDRVREGTADYAAAAIAAYCSAD